MSPAWQPRTGLSDGRHAKAPMSAEPIAQGQGPYSAPRVAVLAVTFRGDEVILVQRRNEPQRGGWGFPGGSIEPGESIHDLWNIDAARFQKLFESR